jgi:hypothetical protein
MTRPSSWLSTNDRRGRGGDRGGRRRNNAPCQSCNGRCRGAVVDVDGAIGWRCIRRSLDPEPTISTGAAHHNPIDRDVTAHPGGPFQPQLTVTDFSALHADDSAGRCTRCNSHKDPNDEDNDERHRLEHLSLPTYHLVRVELATLSCCAMTSRQARCPGNAGLLCFAAADASGAIRHRRREIS